MSITKSPIDSLLLDGANKIDELRAENDKLAQQLAQSETNTHNLRAFIQELESVNQGTLNELAEAQRTLDEQLETLGVKDLVEGLEKITRQVPIMTSRGDYRDGQEHAIEACREHAEKALSKYHAAQNP